MEGHGGQHGMRSTLLSVRPPSHNMRGVSSVAASRFLAAFTRDSAAKDHPGAYDLGELEQPLTFNVGEQQLVPQRNSTGLPRVTLDIAHFGAAHFGNKVTSPSLTSTDSQSLPYPFPHRGVIAGFESPPSQRVDAWGESQIAADNSPCTDTSTVVQHDTKNGTQVAEVAQNGAPLSIKSTSDNLLVKNVDSKAQRRLAQNREAARKSRLRKKAYVQQLENSRMKLNQLEQEVQRARQQGIYMGGGNLPTDQNHLNSNGMANAGAMAFDMEYARWLDEHNRQIRDLRTSVHNHAGDDDLRVLVDAAMSHYDEIFRLKSVAASADVFHLLSGMWKTPAERCFLWMGGHRPSEFLKTLIPQVEPLTEQQLLGICNLQQSCQQAEDALSQGMDNLQ
eukprot:c22852_g2_i1 orf=764-1939(+)